MMPSGWEWAVILVVVLLLFGGRKIPELARGLGQAISEFKKGMKGGVDSIKKEIEDSDDDPAKGKH